RREQVPADMVAADRACYGRRRVICIRRVDTDDSLFVLAVVALHATELRRVAHLRAQGEHRAGSAHDCGCVRSTFMGNSLSLVPGAGHVHLLESEGCAGAVLARLDRRCVCGSCHWSMAESTNRYAFVRNTIDALHVLARHNLQFRL